MASRNKPTNPKLWSRAKSMARSKFTVYPSAYANAWAVRWYNKQGGGWRTVSATSPRRKKATKKKTTRKKK